MQTKECDHQSVGIVVKDGEQTLLIRRGRYPIAMAGPAGHQDDDPIPALAAVRELYEETGLQPTSLRLVHTGTHHSPCRRGSSVHHWTVYEAETTGTVQETEEAPAHTWALPAELEELAARTRAHARGEVDETAWETSPGLEPVWVEILTALGALPSPR